MFITHSGEIYECAVAVKCEDDKYIKLYNAAGQEIAAFHNISDFSEYEILNGSFVAPCDCVMPIPLAAYAIKGRTIAINDWAASDSGSYYYEIASDLISANKTTCNILLFFAHGTELEYSTTQEAGKITLNIDAVPDANIVIESIVVIRA